MKIYRNVQEYDVLVSIHIKQFQALLIRFGKEACEHLLQYMKQALRKQLQPLETMDFIDSHHLVLLLTCTNMKTLYERIYKLDDMLYWIPEPCFHQSVFLGIGIYFIQPKDCFEDAFLHALLACEYSSDSDKLNTHIELYKPSLEQSISRQNQIEERMRKALARKEFEVYLQPKIELKEGRMIGAEALIRWHDPLLGTVYPNELIPIAEHNGFIRELDYYMFEQVCILLESWQQANYPLPCVSVNLSRSHFEDAHCFQPFLDIFDCYQVPSSSLEIEITESAQCVNATYLQEAINDLHNIGMSCSLDDFGSGYSTLASLKELQIDTIKLDRSLFVKEDKKSRIIVESLIQMAHHLDIQCLAEGIETEEQVAWLRELNCDLIQGYVFYKPMTISCFMQTFYFNF